MPWVLVDIAIGVLAVAVLVLVGISLYKHVRRLMRSMGAASERISPIMSGIDAAQSQREDRALST